MAYASDTDSPRFLRFVLGPKAAADPGLRRAVERLRVGGHEVEVRLTWEREDAWRFAREAAEAELDAVVAAGGDGTLNEVVNGVFEAGGELAVGLLPYGTANDFATACGLPADRPLDALRFVTRGERRRLDVAKAGDRRFVNMATAGAGAEITADTSDQVKRRLGGVSYLLTGLSRAGALAAHDITVRAPDFRWRGSIYALAVGNGVQAGGGLRLCPRARLDDGLLDLMLVPEMPLDELLPWLGESFFTGRFLELHGVVYRQVPWLELESGDELQLNLDGEPVHGDAFRFDVEAGRLAMFLPRGELFSRD